jgi:hypothetical protein
MVRSLVSMPLMMAAVSLACASLAMATEEMTSQLPAFLHDRSRGVPTSMFGTYVEPGSLLIYPFFEYYRNDDEEYSPADFGRIPDQDFRGRYRASEGLLFLGYGLTDRISVEVEIAAIDATLRKAADDTSSLQDEINESGLGDVQTQVNWVWQKEALARPEIFSYFEIVYPFNKGKDLIGTQDWEFKLGTGLIRGFGFGTVTARAAMEYNKQENKLEIGEIALEYLKRLSRTWRVYLGVEGVQDEVELITEAQLHLADYVFIKLNNAFGLTSKATDWAPEVGIMFRVR